MKLKTLTLQKNLREDILYNSVSLPLSVCIDNFDDYFLNEWPCHWHDELEFGIIQKGCVQFTIYKDKETICHVLYPGDGIFINSSCLHSAKALQPDTVISEFVISPIFLKQLLKNIYTQFCDLITTSTITDCKFFNAHTEDRALLLSIKELCFITEEENESTLHFVEIVCRIWRLLTFRITKLEKNISIFSLKYTQEKRLKQMLSYIHSHYKDKISIENIAFSASVSRTECFRCFRSILQKTPIEYLEEYRLSMSISLLSNMELSVSEISIMCGFNSTSYFCKRFREHYGFSPKKYRNLNIKITNKI